MSEPADGERLPVGAAATAWFLYAMHAALTVLAIARRRSWPLPVGRVPAKMLGGALVLTGSALYGDGFLRFRSLRQVSGLETGLFVTTGAYRFSRSPQIVGWGLVLGGISLAGRSPIALLLVAALFGAHQLYLPIEERHLERTFGEEYRRYRREAPRYLGLPLRSRARQL